VVGSPAWAIVLEAEALNADLVVVGSQGHSLLGRWILGSVSQTVLTHAVGSVRIGRGRRTQPNRPLHILVGVDGSTEAEKAVRAVARRIWPAGTDIRLMMVLNPFLVSAINTSSLPVE
jgi:nucleotide-binding universal stress UspA family protein